MQLQWVGTSTKKSYADFVGMFDALVDDDVQWTPYTEEQIHQRAPQGLSSLVLRDEAYWLTKKPLLYDMVVEEYHPERVMRQFGRYQTSPLWPPVTTVPPDVHK